MPAEPSSSSTHQRKRGPTAGISRPPTSFILFRQDYARQRRLNPQQTMPTTNAAREAGDAWRALSDGQRQYYVDLAALEKEKHMAMNPDVKLQQQPQDMSDRTRPVEIPVAEPEHYHFVGIGQGTVLRQPAPGHGASYFHSGGLPPSVNLDQYANEVGTIMNYWHQFDPNAMNSDACDNEEPSFAVPQPYNPSNGLEMWNTQPQQRGAESSVYDSWR
ncbi:hypothetical protein BDZ89DRAFT_1162562 [Hymenopellis radicata]|nr:hypothetical protein BDZ89DRAFT_1162562 [Hymenopellis radicata]